MGSIRKERKLPKLPLFCISPCFISVSSFYFAYGNLNEVLYCKTKRKTGKAEGGEETVV